MQFSLDVKLQAEAIATKEHEYTHIQRMCKFNKKYSPLFGWIAYFWNCLPVYKSSWIEKEAIKAGEKAKQAYIDKGGFNAS